MGRNASLPGVLALCCLVILVALPGLEAAGCEPIQLPMCQSMKYNMTQMPNLLHHSAQENARLSIEQFQDLVNTNCSDLLVFFLCTMYAPICTRSLEFEVEAIPPCKGVCVDARRRCEPTMLRYNVTWPEYLSCQHLPEYTRGVCLTPEAIVDTMPDEDDEVPDSGTAVSESVGVVITEPAPPDVIEPPKTKRKAVCKRCETMRVNQGVFLEQAYEYVIRATILSFVTTEENIVYTNVMVRDVLKFTNINIPIGEVQLVTEEECICPKVAIGTEYVIMCHQDLDNGRLRLTDECIAAEWEDSWPRRVQKWNKRLRKAERSSEKNRDAPTAGSSSKRRTRRLRATEAPSRDRRNRPRNKNEENVMIPEEVIPDSESDPFL